MMPKAILLSKVEKILKGKIKEVNIQSNFSRLKKLIAAYGFQLIAILCNQRIPTSLNKIKTIW